MPGTDMASSVSPVARTMSIRPDLAHQAVASKAVRSRSGPSSP